MASKRYTQTSNYFNTLPSVDPIVMAKDFNHLGPDFQLRLLKILIEDKEKFAHDIEFINQNAFTDPIHKDIVGFLKNFYNKNGYIPSYDLLSSLIGDITTDTIKLTEIRETISLLKSYSTEGQDVIKQKAIKFFQNKELTKFFNEQLEALEYGKDITQSDLTSHLQKILNMGDHEEETFGVYDNFEEIFSPDTIIHIPMGCEPIDEYLRGGLIKGNLILLAAGSGVGKTSITTALAQSAALNGFKAYQVLFEDRKIAIQRKHMGGITQIEAMDLTEDEHREKAIKLAQEYAEKDKIKENIKIRVCKNGQLTPEKLKSYIDLEINKGFKPDLLIIDYFECMANPASKTTDAWKLEAERMRQIENFTQDYGCAVVVTTQGTKASAEGMLLTLEKISGSASKYQIGHMVMTINRTAADSENDRATLFIPKNREGKSGRTFNINLNNGKPKISVIDYSDDLTELREAQRQDAEKATLAQNYPLQMAVANRMKNNPY